MVLLLQMVQWFGGLAAYGATEIGEGVDGCALPSGSPAFIQSIIEKSRLGQDECAASKMLTKARQFSLLGEDLDRCDAHTGLAENVEFRNKYTQNLKQIFSDVRVLWETPSASDAAQWKEPVVVVEEGLFRLYDNDIHWFNLATMEIPTLIRFVLAPLQAANRGNASIILPLAGDRDGNNMGTLTDVFSNTRLSFMEGLPYCVHWSQCMNSTKEQLQNVDLGTLLFIPEVYPIGHQSAPCAKHDILAVRNWFLEQPLSSGQVPATTTQMPEGPNQVTLIDRESHLEDLDRIRASLGEERTAELHAIRGISTQGGDVVDSGEGRGNGSYVYERRWVYLPNMDEVAATLESWSAAHGMTFRRVLFEAMPFEQQVATIRSTKVLVGMEGAGLANMVFLEKPAESAVVELNAANGKVQQYQEFPSIAKHLGVPLWMHVFRCFFMDPTVGVDLSALTATMDEVWRGLRTRRRRRPSPLDQKDASASD